MKLTLDLVFPRKRKMEYNFVEPSIYKVAGYSDTENMWEYMHQIGIIKGPVNGKAPVYNLCRLQQNTMTTPQLPTKFEPKEPNIKEAENEDAKEENNDEDIKGEVGGGKGA